MKKLLFVIMMCVAVVANAQSWSKDLEKKAKKGDVTSQIAVANAYAAGDGVKLDLDKAAKWYYAAAKQGNKIATVKLYSFYSKELEKLAKEGDVQAQYEVGEDYLIGDRDLDPNAAVAATWFYKASTHGHAQAKEKLYSYYSKELESLAEKGLVDAQVAIANHYLYANRVKKSTADAAKWYNRAAFQGNETAKTQLFSFYNDELKAHAENGYADAQYALGQCYQYAYEVNHSYSEAMKWYLKASSQGHKAANEALYEFFNKELERRAKQGETKAQYKLGLCYLNGIGVEKNRTTAEIWMKKGFANKEVRMSCLSDLVSLDLSKMDNCKITFHNGQVSGIYDGSDVVNANMDFTDEKGVKYTFNGNVGIGEVEVLKESYNTNDNNGEFEYSQIFTLKKGGLFKVEGNDGFEMRLIDDMTLKVVSGCDYNYFLGQITMSAVKNNNKELTYPLTITYNLKKTHAQCDVVGNVVLPEMLRSQVVVEEERVFMAPGAKNLTKEKLYSLKGSRCSFNDGSYMTISQLDDNAVKEVIYRNNAKSIEIKWDAIISKGEFSRQFNDTTHIYIGENELKLAGGENYKGSYKKLSLSDLFQMISLDERDFVLSMFVNDVSQGVYYYTDGRTEEVINGKLEHVIIEESRKARQAEEQREAETFESERGFLYRKYDREHVDMLYNCIVCDGMDSNLIDEFIEANPNLAEFSYGRQGNIVLLFITFHNDITYCYQVDAQGKTYDVTM